MGGYQSKPSWCGPAALVCALQAHGIRMGQGRAARLMGTTDDGSDEQDIISALDRLGASWDECATNDRQAARSWLVSRAAMAPVLLCVGDWSHWVVVAGCCGDRLWLFDSSPEPWNKAGLGRWCLLPKSILRRWRASRALRKDGPLYYGIALLAVDSAKARICTAPSAEDAEDCDVEVDTEHDE